MKRYEDNEYIQIMEHPLILHKIGQIRRKDTDTKNFHELVSEIAMLMCYEVTSNLPQKEVLIETPICKTNVKMIEEDKIAIIPVLRAGLAMAEGIFKILPNAKVGHVGFFRDEESLLPVEYYCKLPIDCAECEVFVVDPMLATGGTINATIQMLKNKGCTKIRVLSTIAAPEGIEAVSSEHMNVPIYIGEVDTKLNDNGYIVPGLGDAGDRIFGTDK